MDSLSNRNLLNKLKQPVICIVGPTASGKSDLAQTLALIIDAEIISADSMQVYRGMDIGTGKVLPGDRMVPHHCLDLVNPGEPFSAALFQDKARESILDIQSRNKRTIVCGGTGFYVRAAIDDYEFPSGEQQDNPIREKYKRFAEQNGADALWIELQRIDAPSAQCIHPHNTKRVIRALELASMGESYSEQQKHLKALPQLVPAMMFGLRIDPTILNNRINKRVDGMVANGLIDEVRSLLDRGFKDGITAPQAIGYKEIVRALEGHISIEEAIELIKSSTRRYAKRQRSWFRQDKRITWLDADSTDCDILAKSILLQLE